jgi:hypothetical protein
VVINGANGTASFVATANTYSLTGTVTGATSGTVTCGIIPATISATGSYTCNNVPNGTVVVTPSVSGYTVSPTSTTVTVNGAAVSGVNFTATAIPIFTITAGVDAHMYVTPAFITGPAGTVGSFTVTTDTGVVVKSVAVTGSVVVGTPSGNSYPVTINSNGTIHFLGATSNNVYVLNWLRTNPQVLYADQFATTPFIITASTYGTLDHMNLCYFIDWFNQNLPSTYNCVPMADAGYSGGEHMFSLSFVSGLTPASRYDNGTLDALKVTAYAYDVSNNVISSVSGQEFSPTGLGIDNDLELGVVSRSLAVTITQVAPDVFSTPNAINVVRAYSASEGDGYSTTMTRVLALFPDVSRVGVMVDFGRTRDGNISHGGPYNGQPVSGIGSISVIPPVTTLASEATITPSDLGLTAVLHELGHSFSNYLSNSQLPLGDSFRHTTLSTLTPGQMSEENDILQPQSGGGYKMVAPDTKQNYCRNYSALELYLLGLAPASAIPSGLYLNPAYINSVQLGVTIPTSEVFTATGSDVVATYGARNPIPSSSYKFPTIFVGLSEQPMTPAEMAFLNRIAVYLASNETDNGSTVGLFPACSTPSFSIATQGMGVMTTTVPTPK